MACAMCADKIFTVKYESDGLDSDVMDCDGSDEELAVAVAHDKADVVIALASVRGC